MKRAELKRRNCSEGLVAARKGFEVSSNREFPADMTEVEMKPSSSCMVKILIAAGIAVIVSPVLYIAAVTIALKAHSKDDCRTLHLRQIGVRCRLYAIDHEGRFPAKWSELDWDDMGGITNTTWDRLFVCPTVGHGVGNWEQIDLWTDYRLFPGRTTNDPPNTVLAIEPLSNHKSGANVLFVDGSSQWWPAKRVLGETVTQPAHK